MIKKPTHASSLRKWKSLLMLFSLLRSWFGDEAQSRGNGHMPHCCNMHVFFVTSVLFAFVHLAPAFYMWLVTILMVHILSAGLVKSWFYEGGSSVIFFCNRYNGKIIFWLTTLIYRAVRSHRPGSSSVRHL